MNNTTRSNLIKKHKLNKTKKITRSINNTGIKNRKTNRYSKYTSRNNTSKTRIVGDTYEMVDLKSYALWYYKDSPREEYTRFVHYIIENIEIFCAYGISSGYIKQSMFKYFMDSNNISVWVLINTDKRLKIDIIDQIKAFAIVRDGLIHVNEMYGQLVKVNTNNLYEFDLDFGYNFSKPTTKKTQAAAWAELVALCAVSPSIMPKMNINTKLYKPVKFSLRDPETWTEARRTQLNVRKQTAKTVLSYRSKKKKKKILSLQKDQFLKGIGSMLLQNIYDYYKNKDVNGKKYFFLFLEATNTGLFNFYSRFGFRPVVQTPNGLMKERQIKVRDGDYIETNTNLFPMISVLNTGVQFDNTPLMKNKYNRG